MQIYFNQNALLHNNIAYDNRMLIVEITTRFYSNDLHFPNYQNWINQH